jgi:hypothetical protein
MIVKQILEPLYRVKVLIIAKCSPAEANKMVIKHLGHDPEFDPQAYATLVEFEKGKQYILYLRKGDGDTKSHEISHLLDDVYSYRNIKHDCSCPACSEHRAYQQEGWQRIIRDALKS